MKHLKLPLLLAVFLIQSCGEKTHYDWSLSRSSRLIDAYTRMTELDFNFSPATKSLQLFDPRREFLNGKERDALTEKYDDTFFNKPLMKGTYGAYANEFTGITVTSDTDFNDIRPGDNIGAKIRIVSVSPYKWLMSKGALTYDWTSVPADYKLLLTAGAAAQFLRQENHPVNKVLTALTSEDLLLLNDSCVYLIFDETPEIKTHNMTVSILDGENVYSVTKAVIFD